ncbi:MAG TPA: hypothetical protein VKS79_07820 [Gemmataceae bacterium]|nr:hypothetical protein [Gemmataceae bacterium]
MLLSILPIAFSFTDEPWQKMLTTFGLPIVTTVVSFVAGRLWGTYRARQQWAKKDFLGRIIISVNLLQEGKLRIRTIMEHPLETVFPNALAVEKIREAAEKTTKDDPLMHIAKEDHWFLLNFVLNSVAEHFTAGVVKMDAGLPVTKVTYGIFLTCEHLGEERIRKVRALMLRKELLEKFPYEDTMPELESPLHADRIVTLRRAAKAYKTNPEHFLFVEVCV